MSRAEMAMEEQTLITVELIERVTPNPNGRDLPIRSYIARITNRRYTPPSVTERRVQLSLRDAVEDALGWLARTI